jgi:nucleoside-diphosphate-sugar epimerase
MRVFVAGASGAIGRRLLPLLREAGHDVVGTTRSAAKAAVIEAQGARAAVVDVFDAAALTAAVGHARPDVIIHQLTDLPQEPDLDRITAAYPRNARIRIEGTQNLIAAAQAASVPRVIAQSIAFAYAAGPEPRGEDDPLDFAAEGAQAISIQGVVALERLVTQTPGIAGIVLRYGYLYGPGTWSEGPTRRPAVHVDAAAQAAFLAISSGAAGIYNIADDDGAVAISKARADLQFDPRFRLSG